LKLSTFNPRDKELTKLFELKIILLHLSISWKQLEGA